ncbi:beta-galactosidase small subunit [Fulvivirga maritima]|nr:beta-galactosidase small subunit [Fulvivirga maritima]
MKLKTKSSKTNITLTSDKLELIFDKASGELITFKSAEGEYLKEPLSFNFWRAPTDNDFGNGMPKRCKVWKDATYNQKVTSVEVVEKTKTSAKVEQHFSFEGLKSTGTIIYHVFGDGRVEVNVAFDYKDTDMPELPRFGVTMILPQQYDQAEWYGRGSHENYWDRKSSAMVGKYSMPVADLKFDYIRPQENGYRTDTRWLTLTNDSDKGLTFVGKPEFGFSARHNLTSDYDPGMHKKQRHYTNIEPKDLVELNIDYGQTGVGGDDSWGARTWDKYTLAPKSYNYGFVIEVK